MCKWGTEVMVTLCRPKLISGRLVVPVDECIAPLVQLLNDHGVRTIGCCCGHGKGPGYINFEDAEGFAQEIPLETCDIAPAGDAGTGQSRAGGNDPELVMATDVGYEMEVDLNALQRMSDKAAAEGAFDYCPEDDDL